MTKRQLKNIAHSVHDRLLNQAHQTGRPFRELLQYFAMERFLYRLAQSPHAEKFVLKGALMLTVWEAPSQRSTMDVDLLGQLDNDIGFIVGVVKEICSVDVEPDGLVLKADSVQGERVIEAAEYEGVRVRFSGKLGSAQVLMQVDVGFGDVVVPQAKVVEYPALLDFPAPRLRGYSRESYVAEKFEAMVKLGIANSRMKDFYDLWLLSRQFDFDGETLASALKQTFVRRATGVVPEPVALTKEFAQDPGKQLQWRGFIRKDQIAEVPAELGEVVAVLAGFLRPPARAVASNKPFRKHWRAPGPWA